MQISFLNFNRNSQSGPNSFGNRLAQKFEDNGHLVSTSPSRLNLIFIEYAGELPAGSKNILRLDGIWTRQDQLHHNMRIKQLYHTCEAVVWQSEYDKKLITSLWGQPKRGVVIHNGAAQNYSVVSSQIWDFRNDTDQMFICSANWHRQKRLLENIEFFQKNKLSDESRLLVLGHLSEAPRCNLEGVYFGGSISHELCLQCYRIADWMLHLAWRDHCPNVVVEALSQGCPVICTDSGGTKEIVKSNGIILQDVNDSSVNALSFDYDAPPSMPITKITLSKKFDVNLIPTIEHSYQAYYNLCDSL